MFVRIRQGGNTTMLECDWARVGPSLHKPDCLVVVPEFHGKKTKVHHEIDTTVPEEAGVYVLNDEGMIIDVAFHKDAD